LTIIGYRVHDSRLVGGVPFFFKLSFKFPLLKITLSVFT